MLLSDCIVEFLRFQALKNNTPATLANYKLMLNRFITFSGNIDSAELTANIINDYNIYLRNKVKAVSVRTYIRHIRVFVNFCIQRNYCANIYKDIVIPKQDAKIIDVLTPMQVGKLLGSFTADYLGIRNKAMILLMLDCGLRASEVIALQVANINFDYGYIKVIGKGNKERIVPIGELANLTLNKYINLRRRFASDVLFLSSDGLPLTRAVFKKIFRGLRRKTGISKLYPHLLRHTFATNYLLHSGNDIYSLSMLLGHSDVQTTEIYLHYASYYSFMQHKKGYSFVDELSKTNGSLDS